MFCPMCGAPNEDDSVFCGNCGAALTSEEAPVEVEVKAEGVGGAAEEVVDEVIAEEPFGLVPEEFGGDFAAADEAKIEAPPPPPAPAPVYPPSPAVPSSSPPTSGLAIASLLLGIGGLTILPLLGSILAIILGYMARRQIRQDPYEVGGDGLALAGIIMGWIAVGISLLGLLAVGGLGLCGICGAFGSNY